MKKIAYVIILLTVITSVSCKKGREFKTDAGFKYILYTNSEGPKVKIGNYVTISMVYKNSNDSIIFDSRLTGTPIRFKLERIPFQGSYEDGLTYLSANDSATFFVPADSLFQYLNKSGSGVVAKQEESIFTKGSLFKFEIKLLKIQSEVEAEEEMVMDLSRKDKEEQISIMQYLERKKITILPEEQGYYLFMFEKGSGQTIDSGKVVTLEYEGRFLNDSVFDGTKKAGHPYKFISGANHVIRGWEMVMKNMCSGGKFTILLPSKLAFGEEGIRDPKNGSFIVPPFTPLIFDINIISIEDAPAVSRK